MNFNRFDGDLTDWTTPDEIPDPEVLPEVKGYNLLIRPCNPKSVYEGKSGAKILMPQSFSEDIKYLHNVGRVLALGPLCYRDFSVTPQDGNYYPHGRYLEPWCKVGDFVVWGRHLGAKIEYQGVALLLLKDDLILMRLNKPGDINPMYNLG